MIYMKKWEAALIGAVIGVLIAVVADKLLSRQSQMEFAVLAAIAFLMAFVFGLVAWRINITGVAAHSR